MDKLFPSEFAVLKRKIEPLQARRAGLTKQQAPAFDILSILHVEQLETAHSKILAHLLNPTASHAQGTLFLKQFLARLGITDALIDSARSEGIQVESEYLIKQGRLDLLIRTPEYIIVVENKIRAGEGKDQLKRYRRWLDEQKREKRTKVLVYLTPFGNDGSSKPSAVPNNWLSYGSDVVEWLTSCRPSLDRRSRLYGFLLAYIDRAKRIGGAAMEQDDELTDFLLKEDNILTAYDVWDAFPQVNDRLRLTFWRKTASHIRARLRSSKWGLDIDLDDELLAADYPGIILRPPGFAKDAFYLTFMVSVDNRSKSGQIFYGVVYSQELTRDSSTDKKLHRLPIFAELKDDLQSEDFSFQRAYWPGYRNIEGIKLTDKATLLALARDDTFQGRTADRLLELFHKYEGAVSAINAALRSGR